MSSWVGQLSLVADELTSLVKPYEKHPNPPLVYGPMCTGTTVKCVSS